MKITQKQKNILIDADWCNTYNTIEYYDKYGILDRSINLRELVTIEDMEEK